MNGLLAVSALHLAYLNPDLSKSYCTVSAHYQSLALDAFSSRVTDIDETNSDAYYLLAGLIFLMSTFSIAHFEADKLTPNEVAQSFILVQGKLLPVSSLRDLVFNPSTKKRRNTTYSRLTLQRYQEYTLSVICQYVDISWAVGGGYSQTGD